MYEFILSDKASTQMLKVTFIVTLIYIYIYIGINDTRYRSCLGGFETDITHDRVFGTSVNIPTKAFCPPMCVLFVCSESCFHAFGRIDCVGWRLTCGEDGRGWPTGVPQEIPHFSCKKSVIVRHLITRQF